MRKTQQLTIDGRKLQVSNLEKVLYPAAGFRKAQVIEYYIDVAEWLLPHLKNRPVTLKRYPDGVEGAHFYEKDAPKFTPSWVSTFPVPRRSGESDIHYILINDLATLVWSANLANLEIHPFLHLIPEIDRPTAVVFDLDPGEGADILNCGEVALLLKKILDRFNLESLPKVSGSKGIQVYVPLNTPVSYEMTQPFARAVAERLERDHPELVVSAMSKSVRKDRVFIDWSQNADHKTTVSVYSLRAKRAQPFVSVPLKWEELRRTLRKGERGALDFPPDAALSRLRKSGDLFAPALELQQTLTPDLTLSLEAGARRPRKAPLKDELADLPPSPLEFIEPMRARLVSSLPEDGDWQYEIKFDGYRALAIKSGGEIRLLSRNKRLLNRRFPTIVEALAPLADETMVDGEIVALDSRGRPSFNILQNSRGTSQPILYFVFDLLAYRGKDTTGAPLWKRRDLLARRALEGVSDPVRLSETLAAGAAELIAAARDQGLEGIIAKRAGSSYQPGERSSAWFKYKMNQSQELVIGGYKPGKNHFESLLVGYYEGARLLFVGKVKNGFVPRLKEEIFKQFAGLETEVCPFANLPEAKNARRGEALTAEAMKKYRWLKPKLVAQVGFTNWTAANHLRHSTFIALREDKDPHEVTHEIPAGA